MDRKTVYEFDEKNIFSGTVILDDTDKSPSGLWNIPSGCTEMEPIEKKDGYARVWNGSAWEYIEDHRGEKYWLPGEGYGNPGHEVTDIGPLPDGATTTEPEQPLDEMKSEKLAEVNAWTGSKITGGFTSEATGSPVKFDSDTETQLTLQGIAVNANVSAISGDSSGIPVRGYPEGSDKKQVYYLNPTEFMQLCADLSTHIMKCKKEGWDKQDKVKSAQSKEELLSIIL